MTFKAGDKVIFNIPAITEKYRGFTPYHKWCKVHTNMSIENANFVVVEMSANNLLCFVRYIEKDGKPSYCWFMANMLKLANPLTEEDMM